MLPKLVRSAEWSRIANVIEAIVEYAKANPKWKVSIQTHKYMQIP